MRGLVLAGGMGSRLAPLTRSVSKQLLPVYDKPMIYYPLSTLMLAGIREVLVITAPDQLESFRTLLGDGTRWGMTIRFAAQPQPEGIAQAFLIGADFIGDQPVCLVLGDNLIYGQGLAEIVRHAGQRRHGATIFGYRVRYPQHYGVLAFRDGVVTDIVEKPANPPSGYAVPGLYFYGPEVVEVARNLRPSPRGELEITDLNKAFLDRGSLEAVLLGRGIAWLDMGTPGNLLAASQFVETLEARQGLKLGCPEEIAWREGFIDDAGLRAAAEALSGAEYGDYLLGLLGDTSAPGT